MLIGVLGAGYVGLVTAACLAKLGHQVRCVDRDEARIERLLRGEMPIEEPGLAELIAAGREADLLSFHTGLDALHGVDFAVIAVGTLDAAGEYTAEFVRGALLALVADAQAPRRLVIRSTLMPGTALQLEEEARRLDATIELAHNPEFTREGSAVSDFLKPDRVVLGLGHSTARPELVTMLRSVYEPLNAPILVTDLTSAEMIKVASNVFLATKITFANELARLSAAAGADVGVVVDGMGLDRRIGRQFLSPGPGFGGSCFPSQARALPALATELGVSTQLMSAVWPSNVEQARWVVETAEAALGKPLAGTRIALLGLTFKAGTDDLRESPALLLAQLLGGRSAELALYDPSGSERAAQMLAGRGVGTMACPDVLSACSAAELIVCATEWPEFGQLDWTAVAGQANGRLVIDTRRVIDRQEANKAGFEVITLGARTQRVAPTL